MTAPPLEADDFDGPRIGPASVANRTAIVSWGEAVSNAAKMTTTGEASEHPQTEEPIRQRSVSTTHLATRSPPNEPFHAKNFDA